MLKTLQRFFITLFALLLPAPLLAADYPKPTVGDYTIHSFDFHSGQSLPMLHIHYRTLGSPDHPAILILHGTTGSSEQFLHPEFAGELFGQGQLLDAEKYYIILPDDIGHGNSSKPSDGMRTNFPQYGYLDMVQAEYQLVANGLNIPHLRLVMGTSMGGMHTWLWGELHPDFMDALMPLASLPTQISGRNRMWRRMISEVILSDPDWQNGNYTSQPNSLRFAAEMLFFMGSNPRLRYEESPTVKRADKTLDDYADKAMKTMDANDVLYAVESSRDYDPGPALESIRAPLIAVNSADDLINPPDLGILEKEIKRVKNGTAILLPETDQTRGHGTHTLAAIWKQYLQDLLNESQH